MGAPLSEFCRINLARLARSDVDRADLRPSWPPCPFDTSASLATSSPIVPSVIVAQIKAMFDMGSVLEGSLPCEGKYATPSPANARWFARSAGATRGQRSLSDAACRRLRRRAGASCRALRLHAVMRRASSRVTESATTVARALNTMNAPLGRTALQPDSGFWILDSGFWARIQNPEYGIQTLSARLLDSDPP